MKEDMMNPSDIHILFSKYMHEKNLDGLGTLYDKNAMFIPGKDKEPIVGRENIKEVLKSYMDLSGKVEKLSESIHQNGDIALIKLEWCLTTEDGKIIDGTGLGVAKKNSDGKWVYIIENPYGV